MSNEIKSGTLFAPQDQPTMYVVPAHLVTDGHLLVMDSGFLFDARNTLGPRFPLDAGIAIREQNRNGWFGFLPLVEPSRERSGVALFQTRFSWWEAPRKDLILESIKGLREWMLSNRRVPVRLGCPGIPYIPKDEVAGWINEAFKSKATRRHLTVMSRAVPPSDEEFQSACTAPGLHAGNVEDFLTRKEGSDGR